MNTYKEEFQREWERYKQERKEDYPNILLLGISGAGKSSLINRVFGYNITRTSDICPETQGYNNIYYGKKYGMTVNLIDTAGYELNQGDTYYKNIKQTIENGVDGNPIHIIWYCIPVTNERIEEMDIQIIKQLYQEKKLRERICIVFTKCDEDTEEGDTVREYKRILFNKIGSDISSFETSYVDELILDLEELIIWSANALDDEDLKNNFLGAQRSSLKEKRKQAASIIKQRAAIAAVTAAAPIPFSDSAILVPMQVQMIYKIIDVYGVSSLTYISSTVVGDVFISNLGKSLGSNIVKMIPVAGQLVGLFINASVASAITAALGEAISIICYQNVKKYLDGENVNWDEVFESEEINMLVKGLLEKNKKQKETKKKIISNPFKNKK